MPNQYDDDDYDDDMEVQDNGPANLRKALKKAERERTALAEQLASLKAESRQRSVKDVLETKGVDSRIAKFIPSDVEAPEQIASWLDEHAELFGFTSQAQTVQAELSDEARADQRINNATASASTPSRDDDLANRIASAQTKEELMQLMGIQTYGRTR